MTCPRGNNGDDRSQLSDSALLSAEALLHTGDRTNGELRPGDQLPTEAELCERLGVSRAPVRQAMADLSRDGLIYRRAGAGSFVAPQAAHALVQSTELRVLAHYDVRWLASLGAGGGGLEHGAPGARGLGRYADVRAERVPSSTPAVDRAGRGARSSGNGLRLAEPLCDRRIL